MQKKYTLLDISELLADAFGPGRTPRSYQYQHGTRVILGHRLLGEPIPCAPPNTPGTCEADAYFAGQAEGRSIVASLHSQEASMANTAIRRNTGALQMNEILVALSGLSMTADQASDVVRGLAGCIKGDDYERFGSVDLGDVAQTMQDEIEAFEEPSQCGACNGCGEGMHDGTRCRACQGRGETPSQREIERHNMEIAA